MFLPHWPKNIFSQYDLYNRNPLQKTLQALERLNNPHENLPPVIHVTGTNGKGSVIAFLSSIFMKCGYKADVFTSPHIHLFNERIVIANKMASDADIYQIFEEVRLNCADLNLTLFEAATCAFFLMSSRTGSDVCLLEVGMGGRIDPTNVAKNKIANIICTVDFDHEEYLGFDIRAIAAEKSHIMTIDALNVIAPQQDLVLDVIKMRAKEIKADLKIYNHDFNLLLENEKLIFFCQSQKTVLQRPQYLKGDHQLINMSLALAAIKFLDGNIFKFLDAEIVAAIKYCYWPGRIEEIKGGNLLKILQKGSGIKSKIIFDSAHNVSGAQALSHFVESCKYDKICLITGFSKGKAKKEFFEAFTGVVNFIAAVTVEGEPEPEKSDIILRVIKNNTSIESDQFDDLFDAVDFIANKYADEEILIIICGSIYLARDIRRYS